jgi:hypothetical protein
MRPGRIVVVLMVLLAAHAGRAEAQALARARTLYNSADYDGAIAAAALAREQTTPPDTATLVLGRARLERYRLGSDPSDLVGAREALHAVRLNVLSPRDQIDLLIGLGQSLFLGGTYGAALELFDTALARGALLEPIDRRQLLEWWATALDRQAEALPPERRGALFERMFARMQDELRESPGNGPPNYWLAVAARGTGDLDRAWSAAIAGWVRSTLAPATAGTLRVDLDRLVTEVLIPERVRAQDAHDPQAAAAALQEEWDVVKQQWP